MFFRLSAASTLALLLAMPVLPVAAGPWPREQGQVFISLSGERDRSGNSYAGFYAEYGLSRRRTLGMEFSRTNVGETSALVWYQKSLDDGTGSSRLSYAFGGGAIRREGQLLPLSQAALMWGRGFSGIWDGGWLTAEARVKITSEMQHATADEGLSRVEYAYLTPKATFKLDLTAGLRPTEALALVNQLRLESAKDSELSARIATSVVYDIGGPASLEAGLVVPMAGPSEAAFKLGTWLEF